MNTCHQLSEAALTLYKLKLKNDRKKSPYSLCRKINKNNFLKKKKKEKEKEFKQF